MDFKSKASITVTATASPAEIIGGASMMSDFRNFILDAAQSGASASANGLTLVDRNVTFAEDGTATVSLVYEKAEGVSSASAEQGASQAEQQTAQDGTPPPVLPLSLQPLGLTPAAA